MSSNMAVDLNDPALIRQKGMEGLTDALGPLGTLRFIQQFEKGSGDYSKERKTLLADITIEDFKRWREEGALTE